MNKTKLGQHLVFPAFLLVLVLLSITMITVFSLEREPRQSSQLNHEASPWLCSWVVQYPEPPAHRNPCR